MEKKQALSDVQQRQTVGVSGGVRVSLALKGTSSSFHVNKSHVYILQNAAFYPRLRVAVK